MFLAKVVINKLVSNQSQNKLNIEQHKNKHKIATIFSSQITKAQKSSLIFSFFLKPRQKNSIFKEHKKFIANRDIK